MRDKWSKRGFILAAIGSAIGLGNIWRFPYIVGKSGGGAFFIPYFIAIIIACLPLMILELNFGRKLKTSTLQAFKKVSSKYSFIGWVPIILVFGVMSYYFVIAGWTFAYFFEMIKGNFLVFSEFSSTNISLYSFFAILAIVMVVDFFGIKIDLYFL